MKKQDIFDNYIENSFTNHNDSAHSKLMYFRKNYAAYLPLDKSARILDIGCGRGEFLEMLKENNYTDYLGIDIGKALIEYCRKNVTPNVELVDNLKYFLSNHQGMYDLITMFDVIEHIEKKEILEIIPLLKGALKENGILILQTINQGNIFGLLHRYNDFTHEVGINEFSLAQLARLADFSDFSIHPFKIPAISIARIIQIGLREILYFIIKLLHRIDGTLKPRILTPVIYIVCKK